ncbi:LysR family transcriptional regulator [Amycolatopsis mediterranei]|nr:LysR family transcriptional regulator [Amycolatopsis mediterranei]AEK43132.1 LysR family transcriptional regulator [Amycolatopsis mediterranei S699]KDO06275.1 LysR family transcriptional regulator [Amycolatopsis mediterranei]KDU89235.1 LysR family transcriptional regulator [Amycolatopsis mediterranei]UZF76178.1 LysR family transcriptional regulator [Amycolatopsis mediterranei]
MELRQLAVVVAVAEEGGFTAAAQRLRTVQSTVSTVVRALERDLGTPLFHRTTHRVVLTPAGEAFVPAARAALDAAERARAAVSPLTGRVRLGVCPGLLADLHRTLSRLRHTHPGLTLEVRQLPPEQVRCELAESTVDVALTLAPGGGRPEPSADAVRARHNSAPPAEPVTTRLAADELVVVTAPGGSSSVPADVSGLSLVDFPVGWAIRDAVDRAFPRRPGSLEVDDLAVAAGLVRAGLAACLLPASAAARFPDLTVRRFERPVPWQLAAVHRAEAGPAVAAVVAQLG